MKTGSPTEGLSTSWTIRSIPRPAPCGCGPCSPTRTRPPPPAISPESVCPSASPIRPCQFRSRPEGRTALPSRPGWRGRLSRAVRAGEDGSGEPSGLARTAQESRPTSPKTPERRPAVLARFFIDRPVLAWVISVVIILLGAIAAGFLPVAEYPEITPPTVRVTANYPGANAQVVADTVAAPIEQQVVGVDGML